MIGRPSDKVLEQFQRRRVSLGDRSRRVGQDEDVRAGQVLDHGRRRDEAGHGDAVADAERADQIVDARPIGFTWMAPDNQPIDARHPRQRLDEDINAFPRIEMPGVCGDARRARHRRLARPHRNRPRAVRHHEHARSRAISTRQFVRQRSCDRHVRRGAGPHAALLAIQAPELPRGGRELRLAKEPRHLLADRCRHAMRFVDESRPAAGGQLEEPGGQTKVASVDNRVAGLRASHGFEQEAEAPPSRSARHRHGFDPQPPIGRPTVERKRVARLRRRVRPHDEGDVVAPLRQRPARRHRLHAVGALDGKASIGEGKDVQIVFQPRIPLA